MKHLGFALTVLILAIVFAGIAGCTSSTTITPATTAPAVPQVTITSPQNGAALSGTSIPVTIQVSNFNIVDKQGQAGVAGQGHVHFYLDVSPIPSDPAKPAIPADAKAVWAHVSGTSYTFTNVSPGTHTITVQLANNDHTPVSPLVTASATITVTAGGAPAPATTAAPAASGSTKITLTAKNVAFDKSSITVPAGAHVVMTFDNQDSGVAHNFALYTDSSAKTRIFVGDFITGPKTTTYTFDAPSAPGTYYFRCDVHPTIMFGSFVVT